MTTLYLIRHAEAEGNLYRRIQGWYNSLITDHGFLQIEALARRFRDIPVDAVYSSDLYRTMTTARAVTLPKGLELHTDPDLREIHMGDWENWTWGEAARRVPRELDRFLTNDPSWQAPNGDSFGGLGLRVERALHRIAAAHPGQTVAVFSHGTAIRQAVSNIKGVAPADWARQGHSANTAVTCLTYEDGTFTVKYEMDRSHLDELEPNPAGQSQKWFGNSARLLDTSLWFRPADWPRERDFYLAARRSAWTGTHGTGIPFDGAGFLRAAEEHLSRTPWGVTVAMAGAEPAGILQLDPERYRGDNAGYIPFCYIVPQRRAQNLGVQLIGQAVSFYRPLGRDKLRLRCAPYNDHARYFYGKYGFCKIGEEQGSRVPLDILEKYIGYER